MGELCDLPCGAQPFGEARDALVDEVAAEAPGDEVEVRTGTAGTRGKRPRQALAELVDLLRHRREQRLRLGPATDGQLEPFACPFDAPRQAFLRPMLEVGELRHQLGADRYGNLRRSGRRRRAPVGGVVDQGGVGLVADRRDQRNRRFRRGAHHFFLVEGPEVLDRPSPAGDDQQVGPTDAALLGERVAAANRGSAGA